MIFIFIFWLTCWWPRVTEEVLLNDSLFVLFPGYTHIYIKFGKQMETYWICVANMSYLISSASNCDVDSIQAVEERRISGMLVAADV